jgi:DNA-binding transcriptional ArsR family regulator
VASPDKELALDAPGRRLSGTRPAARRRCFSQSSLLIHARHYSQHIQDAQRSHVDDHGWVPREPERPGQRVEADLRRRVLAGEWSSRQALPTVAVLADHYGVSRGTAARALRVLAEEGLVEVVPRWGTFKT